MGNQRKLHIYFTRNLFPTHQSNLIHERKSILYNTIRTEVWGLLLVLLFRPSSSTPSNILLLFYPINMSCRPRFPLQRIDFKLSKENFSLLLSENDIGWQTFTMLFRGRTIMLTSFAPSPPFLGLFNLLVLNLFLKLG